MDWVVIECTEFLRVSRKFHPVVDYVLAVLRIIMVPCNDRLLLLGFDN